MLDVRRRACLAAMGIDLWRIRGDAYDPEDDVPGHLTGSAVPAEPDTATGSVEHPAPGPTEGPRSEVEGHEPDSPLLDPGPAMLSWDELEARVASCTSCDLHPTRTQTVFGVGDRHADLMIIGEAPGADEDRLGEPFVGRAGKLLDAMLEAIGFSRSQVYIANIIKCRPPGNRDPHIEEAAACQPYLHRQIALIQPRLILSVGRISAHNLLGTEESVGRLRGRVHRFDPGDIPLIVTYHPAYLLRRPQEKSKSWQDLQAAYRQLHQA